jgi:phosphatidylglycerophosphatase C
LRSDVQYRLQQHIQAGHRVLLVSGSPDIYVTTFARILEIPEVVCTRVEQRDGKCTGHLASANCKGDQKVSMLREYLRCEQPPENSSAYGDSRSDLPLLRWVKFGFSINRWSGCIVPLGDSKGEADRSGR